MARERQLIFVLGMHRSGTSAVTRLLNLLGAGLGHGLLEAQKDVNELGFWENEGVVRLDESILRNLDSHWFDFREYPQQWWLSSIFEDSRSRIRDILNCEFADSALTAIKDPRLCRLLPVWLEEVRQEGISHSCLMVLRNPAEVARSLEKRDGIDRDAACYLWLIHVLDAEFYSRGMPRALVSYDQVLSDWRSCAVRMEKDLGVSWPILSETVEGRIDRALRSDLRHFTADNGTQNPGLLSDLSQETYRRMTTEPLSGNESYLDAVRQDLYRSMASCGELCGIVYRTNRSLLEERSRLTDIGGQHAKALEVIRTREEQLSEVQEQLRKLGSEHSYALEVIRERDRTLDTIRSHWSWYLVRLLNRG